MILLKLNGRLGNQMFQYAFSIAVAQILDTCIQIDSSMTNNDVESFFDTQQILRKFKPSKFDIWLYRKRKRLGMTKMIEEDVTRLIPKLSNHCIYNGYFQNETYFRSNIDEVRLLFKVATRHQELFKKVQGKYEIQEKIVIHVRLKDYLLWNIAGLGGPDLSLPAAYYLNAIQEMGSGINDRFLLISDDTALALERLKFLSDIEVVDEPTEVVFQIMMHAKRLIISNSSFAWWAAWLNPNQPQVMAPKHWLGFKVKRDYPYGIMPKAFTPVDF